MKILTQNNNHKRYLIILVLMIIFVSCKEETNYLMQIKIKNESGNMQTVQLFPKSGYLIDNMDGLYKYSDLGNGDYGDKYFDLDQDKSKSIFMTSDINQEPYNLALKIFDSIYIISSNEDKTIIKFYPDTVIGYTENLFDNNSIWSYEKRNYDEPTNFKRNPSESYEYTFVISNDKNW